MFIPFGTKMKAVLMGVLIDEGLELNAKDSKNGKARQAPKPFKTVLLSIIINHQLFK